MNDVPERNSFKQTTGLEVRMPITIYKTGVEMVSVNASQTSLVTRQLFHFHLVKTVLPQTKFTFILFIFFESLKFQH